MLMCSRCKKRPAVVFISQMNAKDPQHKKNEGLCLVCAKELGISQVDDYMKAMGISDDDLEAMSNQLMEASDGDDFEPGGTNFLSNLFGGDAANLFSNLAGGMPKATDEGGENKPKDKKKKLKFLNNYCTNLTQKAREGKLDNVVGRDKEISRVIHILSRRQKNNPCLIGEPGVGKTAIAEGIAQRIVGGDVPFHIKDKELYLLDLTALVAGTQFRGQFESRCKGLVEEVKEQGNVILFIDEVHTLVGTGDNEGTMNAANILKPSLSRGEIQVIGATTFKEYRKYIEKDSALERRFQPVTVSEPTVEDTITVLEGIKQYYENFHRVKISDDMLRECAVLSERYINDRFLPDKAIDLLDEACACTSIRTPEIEEFDALNEELKKHEKLVEDYEQKSDPDYEIIAKEKGEILRIQNRLKEVEETLKNVQVTEEDISKVIELWTGIPANKIAQTEYDKIKHLKEALSKRVIGQDEAVDKVAKAIKRTRVQLSKRRRPASFIFVGPTGVGKTELVKVLGEELFDATEPLIRVDMTEYMEKHSVSKLIGSPPGYVGFDEAGQLTEKVRRRPYSVVLFDEIEKAHPDVMNILLQILDEGRINDSQGRSVSFENTVIVMTSNAGSTDRDTGVGFNKTDSDIAKDKAMKALREFLRPEFLGRIDEIVVFNPLTEENFAGIAGLMLDEMKSPLEEKHISLRYTDEALKTIAHKAYGQKLGARDIRRVIRNEVEDKIAELLIDKGEGAVSAVAISADNGEIKVDAL
ncbi:ATP-dependent Clp protease ATP-binding subunit [Ruminococcus sp. AF17-6LB]|uniref:ATP-dependent Clp protease ATP-binding subunit n=1 Tax=unclassified Ruminococcus TaxID=2608920 RepID=UPI000E4F520C|nr:MULTISPECIES: ATP-dependent Clp protease ATP-binding subunit [unclassified Ruminococcus]RGG73109.1 ATP-dependent Clp protease ATP-binding subunit [Ruminococcus sp. AF17-6LB]RGG74756.1 ATP-dependent Clp protease ATP-binding subunit [Ruminococcus sp. AF17-6]RGG75146.1 ATP-dependent Clp protease ATP-binding subunit [Ruminococcus sp. AF17-24]RGG81526.1 ATP-dependent Clp protease ATP-binding subunit [Ruminococcus sp. AF17-1AC]